MPRTAACHCGSLTLAREGEPAKISLCHCLYRQRRTGAAGGAGRVIEAATRRVNAIAEKAAQG